jgi:hypothetical protein
MRRFEVMVSHHSTKSLTGMPTAYATVFMSQ